jgi:hypothetical protein
MEIGNMIEDTEKKMEVQGEPSPKGLGEPKTALSEHIAHQVRYARGERGMARWDRQMGYWPKSLSLGRSPGFYRAAIAMKLARAWKLEEKTGIRHCMCHLRPYDICPSKPDSLPYWKRGKAVAQ